MFQHYRAGLTACLSLLFAISAVAQVRDIGAMMGSGNFVEGETNPQVVSQYKALNAVGLGMNRFALYPNSYYPPNLNYPTPQYHDNAVLLAHQHGITPMILFEYYGSYKNQGIPLGGYSKWYNIGQAFAERFRPNSPWLQSKGIHNWGITVYSAMNEPDSENLIPKTGTESYQTALEGLADGVHSISGDLKVIPGGFMEENAGSNHTLNGYGPAIAPLLNNGKLDGIDLHTYNDVRYAPISNTFAFSAQSDFDEVKAANNITRDINFYMTEFNFKKDPSQGIDETLAAKRMLTAIWAGVGVVKNDGTLATQMSLVWNLFNLNTQDDWYGLAKQLDPFVGVTRADVLKLAVNLSRGMKFEKLDPKGRGEYILSGNNKKLYVWQNLQHWTNIPGTSYTLTGLPSNATKVEVYGWNGLRATYNLSGQSSFTVSGLAQEESYMFLVHAPTPNPNSQPDLVVTDITWTPANPASGADVTFSATIKNQGTAATPNGVIHGVGFLINETVVSWSANSTAALAAGASRTVTADGGPSNSALWTAGANGTYTIKAFVDDVNRITNESNESNNQLSKSLVIGSTMPVNSLVAAVNVNGPALSIGGVAFQAESTSGITISGASRFANQNAQLTPATDAARLQMIRSSAWNSSGQMNANLPIANGSYNVYLYTWEDNAPMNFQLAFEGAAQGGMQSTGAANTWKRIGPYTANVGDGGLTLTVTGGHFMLSGIEVYRASTATAAAPTANDVYKTAAKYNGR